MDRSLAHGERQGAECLIESDSARLGNRLVAGSGLTAGQASPRRTNIRHTWRMPARASRCAFTVVIALTVAGCAQTAATSTDDPTMTPSPATSAMRSSPTSPSTSTSNAAASPTSADTSGFPDSQQAYTSLAVRAWGVGDRARAGQYATAAAVRQLFREVDEGGPGWSLTGCDNAGPRPACTFSDPGQGQRLVLFYDSARLGQPRAILEAEFIADDPTAPVQ